MFIKRSALAPHVGVDAEVDMKRMVYTEYGLTHEINRDRTFHTIGIELP